MEQSHKVRVNLEHISKTFVSAKGKKREVVEDVSFEVYDNEFLVLLGPGRCGKTVLLNIMAGILDADEGKVTLDGEEVKGPNPQMGMVFQKTGLLPWLTVMENTEFGPKMRGISKEKRRQTAQHFIDLVGLNKYENHYPYQLSGGMKQRVGIARAYSNEPKLLIMDEPFGALDAQTRYNMQNEVLDIAQKEKRTIIFVTNNIEEALLLGDRIILFTSCPARIKEIYNVNLPKPRDTMQKEFLQLRREISDNTDLAL
ncbi:ABC transporter [Clostridium sp. chh4-2]|uniref:ABC transporter ATP-binding protein n=1 Tax=Clostridium sp. chh4-2 TaxID=2067550 RepID=UPI000CCF5389|nr:ABC transporter ATP-binding protein [Clostridium sp. chh4-2]PNV60179.1 ABC transporter [Clostridium sp. chh4-2]